MCQPECVLRSAIRDGRGRKMVTIRDRRVKSLAPSLAGVASHPSARAQVAQRFASPAGDHESPITDRRSRALAPSTQTGTPRWTHPLVSRWKHSPRVESARNFIPGPSFLAEHRLRRLGDRSVFGCHPLSKFSDDRLTFITYQVECKFVCSPSCRPGNDQLFDNQMNQARTRLVCP